MSFVLDTMAMMMNPLLKHALIPFATIQLVAAPILTHKPVYNHSLYSLFYAKFLLVITHRSTLQTKKKDNNVSVLYYESISKC